MTSYEEIDFSTLSRRELQALCKGQGIPANKTNVFMADALAKKRAPLSKMDSNREQKVVISVGKKNNASDVNRSSLIEQKPVLFQNNFLKRGGRKEAPALRESGDEPGNARRPHQTLSTKAKAESKVDTRLSSGTAAGQPDVKPSIVKCPDDSVDASRNVVKQKIDDRVRSQIDASLCSKVMKPSQPEQEGNILQEKIGNCATLTVLAHPEQRGNILQEKIGNCATLTVLAHPEQQMESFRLEQPLACQTVTKEETAPFPLSPLLRVEEKVLSVVERIQNFWKGSRDLVVKSFGSPEEVVNG